MYFVKEVGPISSERTGAAAAGPAPWKINSASTAGISDLQMIWPGIVIVQPPRTRLKDPRTVWCGFLVRRSPLREGLQHILSRGGKCRDLRYIRALRGRPALGMENSSTPPPNRQINSACSQSGASPTEEENCRKPLHLTVVKGPPGWAHSGRRLGTIACALPALGIDD